MQHLHDGDILSLQMQGIFDIHDLVDRYVTRVNGVLDHTKRRSWRHIERMRIRL